jgi:hypothetical protein
MEYDNWIVSEIPGLHRMYANLGDDGHWVYWEPLADGRWKWNPKWVKYDNETLRNILADLESEWMDLLKKEEETPQNEKTNEWYKFLEVQKKSLDSTIVYYQKKLGINNT